LEKILIFVYLALYFNSLDAYLLNKKAKPSLSNVLCIKCTISTADLSTPYGTLRNGFGAKNKASNIVVFPELFAPSKIVNGASPISPLFYTFKVLQPKLSYHG